MPTQPDQSAASPPAVPFGTGLQEAGPWAAWIKNLDWPRGRWGHKPSSTLIDTLVELPSRNEPVLRFKHQDRWTSAHFSHQIRLAYKNIEATLIQVVGSPAPVSCRNCRQEDGIFSHCITVPGVPACGNCHWAGRGDRCTLNSEPRSTPTPKTRQGKVSQEGMDERLALIEARRATSQALQNRRKEIEQLFKRLHAEIDQTGDSYIRGLLSGADTSDAFSKGSEKKESCHQRVNQLEGEVMALTDELFALDTQANELLRKD